VADYLTSKGALKGEGMQRQISAAAKIDISSTALCDAAARGDCGALRKIARAGGDVNLGDYDKRTAIHLASSEGMLDVVRCLHEELSADHSPWDRWDNTPLDDAVRSGHKEVIDYLTSKGARKGRGGQMSEHSTGSMSVTLLCNAAASGDLNVIRVADVLALAQGDYDKRTPFHLAASEGHVELVELLLSRGVPHSPFDRWGNTPLDDATRQQCTQVVEILEKAGAVRGQAPPRRGQSMMASLWRRNSGKVRTSFTASTRRAPTGSSTGPTGPATTASAGEQKGEQKRRRSLSSTS